MAISLLSIPARAAGSPGYVPDQNAIIAKINELAAAMSLSSLTISAAVGAGNPAADFNTVVQKVNELIGLSNGGTTTPPPSGADVMIGLDGQSQPFGDGPLAAEYAVFPLNGLASNPLREYQRVKIFNPIANDWQKLQAGVNSRSVTGQADGIHVGPEIGLAYRWEEDPANNGKTLYIFKYAINGANIEQWINNTAPNLSGSGPEGYGMLRDYFWNRAKAKLTAMGVTAEMRGWLWWQGESNGGDANYAQKLTQYYNLLLADGLITSATKFLVANLKADSVMQAQQQQFVSAGANRVLLDAASLSRDEVNGDSVHVNGAGQMKMGRFLVYDAALSRVSPRPQEATLPVCDDVANVFKFTPNPQYPNPGQWSFMNETTGVVTPIPANTPVVGGKIVYNVGDVVAAINSLSVFVSEVEGLNMAGVKLYNNAMFTGGGTYTGAVATSGNTYQLSSAPEANKSAGWNSLSGGVYLFNANVNDGQGLRLDLTFEIHFTGTGLSLTGLQNGAYGVGRYELDGGAAQPVNFNGGEGAGVVLTLSGLTNGAHVFKFTSGPPTQGLPGYCTPGSVTIL